MIDPQPNPPVAPATRTAVRKRALTVLTGLLVVVALGWGTYEWLVASHYESTDDAYVQGNLIQITPQVGGAVIAVLADDTDFVKAGQPLVKLDPADASVALEQSKAALAQAVRQVRALYAGNAGMAAQIAVREADLARSQTDVARASDDLDRRKVLAPSGAISTEDLQHAQTQFASATSALAAARAGVNAARDQWRANQAMTDGVAIESHPAVLVAAAKVREAWLAAQRMVIPAPTDGYVARRSVQLGQRVAAGTPLMTVIALNELWVDANFKEVQLRHIRIGQPVKLTADLYGTKVEYSGRVAGLGVGTGAAFALLPAQNATGNWIKVVQRVPVRVTLDARQLAEHPLRVGLSMLVTVDVSQHDGKALADEPRARPLPESSMYDSLSRGADEEVRKTVAANLGQK